MKYPNSRQCSNLLVLCEEVKNNTPQVVLLLFLNKVCILSTNSTTPQWLCRYLDALFDVL